MIFLYDFVLFCYKTAIYVAAFFNPKAKLWLDGRRHLFAEMAQKLPEKKEQTTVWIHVASLGEFEQGRPLIEKIKKERPDWCIILTFFSPSGFEMRKNYPLVDHVFYLPLDTRSNAHRFLTLVKPDLAIFVKYEFWFHFLHALKTRQIPTLLISGIFRKNLNDPLSIYGRFLRKILPFFTHFFLQKSIHATSDSLVFLKKAGFNNADAVGDTRIDRVLAIAQEAKVFPEIEHFVKNTPTLICGSTWAADEAVILPILKNEKFADWTFIFAPHDIAEKNIKRLEDLLDEPFLRFSTLKNAQNTEPDNPLVMGVGKRKNAKPRILIIDNIGMLSALYRYGRVAYIGGGFGKGIHNTLEPIAHGLPVVFGEKYQKFEEALALVQDGGGFSIQNTIDFQAVMEKLSQQAAWENAALAAKNYVTENQGATEKIWNWISSNLTIKKAV